MARLLRVLFTIDNRQLLACLPTVMLCPTLWFAQTRSCIVYMMENVHLTASFMISSKNSPCCKTNSHQVSVIHAACGIALPGCPGELDPLYHGLHQMLGVGGGVQCGVDTADNKHSSPKKRKDCHQHWMGSAVWIKNIAVRAFAEAGIGLFATTQPIFRGPGVGTCSLMITSFQRSL